MTGTALTSVQGSPLSGNQVSGAALGTNSAASAPVITPAFSGTASQLNDTTRDYVVYLCVTTSGTATTVEFGPTSSANAVVLVNNASVTAGQVVSFRLPAGWFVKASGTSTVFSQSAVGC